MSLRMRLKIFLILDLLKLEELHIKLVKSKIRDDNNNER